MKSALKWVGLAAVIVGLFSIAKDRLLFVDWDRERAPGLGTAFPLGDGIWATARHVIDGCDALAIGARPPRGPGDLWTAARAELAFIDPDADVALLRAAVDALPHRLAETPPEKGSRAVVMGFPAGRAAFAMLEMRDTRRIRSEGDFALIDRTTIWRVDGVTPGDLPGFDGISGGPVFDAAGAVVGVMIGSTTRGTRAIVASHDSLVAAVARARVPPNAGQGPLGRPNVAMVPNITRPIFCEVDE